MTHIGYVTARQDSHCLDFQVTQLLPSSCVCERVYVSLFEAVVLCTVDTARKLSRTVSFISGGVPQTKIFNMMDVAKLIQGR